MAAQITYIFRLREATLDIPIYDGEPALQFTHLIQAMAEGVKAAGGTVTRIDNTPTETRL